MIMIIIIIVYVTIINADKTSIIKHHILELQTCGKCGRGQYIHVHIYIYIYTHT